MKKLLAVTGVILIAYLALTAVVSDNKTAASADMTGCDASESSEGYIVADHDGRVAVFSGGRLIKITDTLTASLPKADMLRLEEGIEVYSDKELKRVMEDICS